ncbi:hypothetical protein K3495_g733 [Podosphaera aphanis]|nr:hypothetical protein K3495_g733 [Podosphaera aphanis]
MGFNFSNIKKGVYIDGHEREDVVKYREEVIRSRKEPFDPQPNEKPLVFVTNDEPIFNANDGKRQMWINRESQPLQPKGKEKDIMASTFLTPGGILKVPNTVPDEELMRDASFPRDESRKPVREASLLLEYGKDNCWTGENLVGQTTKVAIPILRYAFPNFQAVFVFDNPAKHCAFAPDALLVSKMNLGPGGRQSKLRDGWNFSENVPQKMNFGEDHPDVKLRGQPKGVGQILIERFLWHDHGADGRRFL